MSIKKEAEELENIIEDSLFKPDDVFTIDEQTEEEFRGLDLVVMNNPERKELVGTPNTDTNIDDDYDYVRKTYQYLIAQGQQTLKTLLELIKTNPDPRSFESANNLMRQIGDNTDKLLKVQKDYKELKKVVDEKTTQSAETINNNNIVFKGSLKDVLREMESGTEIIDAD